MPTLSTFFGIIIRMWHDDHPPPHIHVEYQGFEALVDIADGRVSSGELPRKVAAIVQEWCLVHQQELHKTTGFGPNDSSRSKEYKEQIVIKILDARYDGNFIVTLRFSDGNEGHFNGAAYLKNRSGSLLAALEDEAFFKRFFIDAGALCWPNGLELSPQRLHELCLMEAV